MDGNGMVLMEPTDLYNLLNQQLKYPMLSDPNYLLLLDVRRKPEYNESHVITAKRVLKGSNDEFLVPYDAEIECKQHVVIYDGRTTSLKEDSAVITCAKEMWHMGSRNPVYVLNGGFETFSALYPFLRTQKILYVPREMDELQCYPIEIVPGLLYLGDWTQGNAAYIQKDLKIRGHINCCVEPETFFKDDSPSLLHIPVEDTPEANILQHLENAVYFIDQYRANNENVLVFSKLGISRSVAVVIAYLIFSYRYTVQQAYDYILKCSSTIRPNSGFMRQLAEWEKIAIYSGSSSYDVAQDYGGQAYDGPAYDGQVYGGQAYDGQVYGGQAYDGQAYDQMNYQQQQPAIEQPNV